MQIGQQMIMGMLACEPGSGAMTVVSQQVVGSEEAGAWLWPAIQGCLHSSYSDTFFPKQENAVPR